MRILDFYSIIETVLGITGVHEHFRLIVVGTGSKSLTSKFLFLVPNCVRTNDNLRDLLHSTCRPLFLPRCRVSCDRVPTMKANYRATTRERQAMVGPMRDGSNRLTKAALTGARSAKF